MDELKKQKIATVVVKEIIESGNNDIVLNFAIGARQDLDLAGFKQIDQDGVIYNIETVYGKGKFFDAHRLYKDGKYPNYIKPGLCFSNAYAYALTSNKEVNVVSGICLLGKPFLHSVVETAGGLVIDFNYSLVMEAELYYELFSFERLAEVKYKQIQKNKNLCLNNNELFSKYESPIINFAFEELIKEIKTATKETGVNN